MKQEAHIGPESVKALSGILEQEEPQKIFLVTGKSSYTNSHAEQVLTPLLEKHSSVRFSEFEVNPRIEDIREGMRIFTEEECDLTIAVGGGSVIDIAKSINILASHPSNPEEYITHAQELNTKGSPFVAIPTTSGSGSEATHFAVAYINKVKYSLAHPFMLPDYAIVDSQFAMTMPAYLAACAGFDAFSQAIESYWNVHSTEESKSFAKEAIELVMNNLTESVTTASPSAREGMAKASYLSGKAVNLTKSTACHAVSYPITSHFDVPHGHAVALTLPSMLIYNANVSDSDVLDARGANYVKNTLHEIVTLLGAQSVSEASGVITDIMVRSGLQTRLSEVGVNGSKDIELILKGVSAERMKNNPRSLTESNLYTLLEGIL